VDIASAPPYTPRMQNLMCRRILIAVSTVPLPALLIAVVLRVLLVDARAESFPAVISIPLAVAGAALLASLCLAVVCGLLDRRGLLLFPALLALLDIGLFVLLIPENEASVGWRAIDLVLVGFLLLHNVYQIVYLRSSSKQ